MKRRVWQIHLLTAVVGMIVAGGFVGLNLNVRCLKAIKLDYVVYKQSGIAVVRGVYHVGWPADIAYTVPVDLEKDIHASEVDLRKLMGAETATGSLSGKPVLTLEDVQREDPSILGKMGWHVIAPESDWYFKAKFQKRGIAINSAVALATILVLMVGTEWFLRRRERAKV